VIVGLVKLTNYLLDQQLRALEKALIQNGGLREAMMRARVASGPDRAEPFGSLSVRPLQGRGLVPGDSPGSTRSYAGVAPPGPEGKVPEMP